MIALKEFCSVLLLLTSFFHFDNILGANQEPIKRMPWTLHDTRFSEESNLCLVDHPWSPADAQKFCGDYSVEEEDLNSSPSHKTEYILYYLPYENWFHLVVKFHFHTQGFKIKINRFIIQAISNTTKTTVGRFTEATECHDDWGQGHGSASSTSAYLCNDEKFGEMASYALDNAPQAFVMTKLEDSHEVHLNFHLNDAAIGSSRFYFVSSFAVAASVNTGQLVRKVCYVNQRSSTNFTIPSQKSWPSFKGPLNQRTASSASAHLKCHAYGSVAPKPRRSRKRKWYFLPQKSRIDTREEINLADLFSPKSLSLKEAKIDQEIVEEMKMEKFREKRKSRGRSFLGNLANALMQPVPPGNLQGQQNAPHARAMEDPNNNAMTGKTTEPNRFGDGAVGPDGKPKRYRKPRPKGEEYGLTEEEEEEERKILLEEKRQKEAEEKAKQAQLALEARLEKEAEEDRQLKAAADAKLQQDAEDARLQKEAEEAKIAQAAAAAEEKAKQESEVAKPKLSPSKSKPLKTTTEAHFAGPREIPVPSYLDPKTALIPVIKPVKADEYAPEPEDTGNQGAGEREIKSPGLSTTAVYSGCGKKKGCAGDPPQCVKHKSCQSIISYGEDEHRVKFQIMGKAGKYVAIGLSRDLKMGGDSVVECVREYGTQINAYVSWNYDGKKNKREKDHSSISGVKGAYTDGFIICEFWRLVITTFQNQTFDLKNEEFFILHARGNQATEGLKGNVGYHGEGATSTKKMYKLNERFHKIKLRLLLEKLHTVLMVIAWLFCFPTAAFLARYYKETYMNRDIRGYTIWYSGHVILGWLGAGMVFLGMIFISVGASDWLVGSGPNKWNFHNKSGMALVVIVVVEVVTGYLIKFLNTRAKCQIANYIHGLSGHCSFFVAFANMYNTTSFDNGLPCSGATLLVLWLVIYLIIHLLMSYQVCYQDFVRGDSTSRAYNIFHVRGIPHPKDEDVTGSPVRKIFLCIFTTFSSIVTMSIMGVYFFSNECSDLGPI